MDTNQLYKYQSDYLDILNEFFIGVVGKCSSSFISFDDVHNELKNNLDKSDHVIYCFSDMEKSLSSLYSSRGPDAFKFAKELNACKLVLGGSSRFYGTQLNATKRSLLFADTVLVPDPILPYLERERAEEKFQYIHILKAAFFVLQMKDLNSSAFDMLPFFIFPSWEKSLEEYDQHTQVQAKQLITDVFSHYVDSGIKSADEIYDFAVKNERTFLKQVEKNQLFVAPGRQAGDSVRIAMGHYKTEMLRMRNKAWCDEYLRMPEIAILINAVCERIFPQYHLLENADELKSNPLLCVDSQAHYYQLVSSMKNSFISDYANFDTQTTGIVNALNDTRLDFLSNIPYDQMIQIRTSNENVEFRKQLRELVNSLPTTKIDDLAYVSSEVCAYVEASISRHRKEIELIKAKYKTKHTQTALIGTASLAVALYPVLAPFITGLGLTATSSKYLYDKLEERNDLKQASHSLMGVVSLAKSQ
ncbi:hypothetical protein AB6E39_26430 [Vibrio splendidus]|uniref:hypothetical protein n=1 Tax=Vibrio splendidus TaxID=29497 RepID=UPI001E34587E|nr:hypothetical protein [Vibrio splendidus]MCC4791244.1 hypothetical protein [Vibrio splendidus]